MRSVLAVISVLLVGCLGDRPGQPDTSAPNGSDTTAAAMLRRADRGALDRAMSLLVNYNYLRDRRIEVSDESGRLILRYGHTTQFFGRPDERTSVVRDTTLAGEGSAGFWEEYAGSPSLEDTLEWSKRLLPDDPLVLGRQGAAYYQYSESIDTTIEGVEAHMIEAELVPGTSRAGIQSGRFYVSTDLQRLIGFDVILAHRSLLFDEESRFRYLLQKGVDDAWLPFEVTISTFLNLPLSKGQRFKLQARYVDPEPIGGD